MMRIKTIGVLCFLLLSSTVSSQYLLTIDTDNILYDSIDKTTFPFFLELANEKPTEFEIILNISGGLPGNTLIRMYCDSNKIQTECYYFEYYLNLLSDSFTSELHFQYKEKMKLDSLTSQQFIDSLLYYDFFSLIDMDSSMRINRDTLASSEIRINEYHFKNFGCNKIDYQFEYKIGNFTRSYSYEALTNYLKVIPERIEFQKAIKIVKLFQNHLIVIE